MNIQQRTAKTLSPPGLSATPDIARVPREERLRAHEDRLAVTYEHVGVGIAEIDQAGRMLRVNQKVCELTGHEAADLLGRSIFDETAPQDVAQDLAQFRRQVAGEIDRYTIEKRLARKDGSYFWAEVTSSSVRDASGNFLYAVRVQHDISARKETEQALARRSEEQAALFRFSERLQYATSLPDVYDAGLDAILAALACERASILLFDDSDVMRFVGWRGLSDGYRNAVEGHSPWDRDEGNPRPVYFEDIGLSDLSVALKETIAREHIAAVAFIPILIGGRLAGKFMAYYEQAASLHRTGDRRRADAGAATRLRHRETEGGRGAQRRRRACAATRLDRGILRRCDHQQGSGRDHPDLEFGRRAAVRL